VLGDIVCQDNAKRSQLCIRGSGSRNNDILLRNVLKSHSSVTELVYGVWSWHQQDRASGDRGLEYILQALEGRLGQATCQVTTIELHMDPTSSSLYFNLIQSILHWTA